MNSKAQTHPAPQPSGVVIEAFKDLSALRKVITIMFLVAPSLLGCQNKNEGVLSTQNEVAIAISSDMTSLNPLLAFDYESYSIHCEVWQPLNQLNPKTYRLMPVIGSLPVVSEDHLTYTYTLDPRACFSDGVQVTPEDVIFTFKTIKNICAKADVKRNKYLDLDSMWSPSQSVIAFHFTEPKFNREYTITEIPILPKHSFEGACLYDRISWQELNRVMPTKNITKAGEAFANMEQTINSGRFIGSGPYVFEDWKRGQFIKLRHNPRYWASQIEGLEAYPDRLVYRMFGDGNSTLVALKSKEIDIASLSTSQYLNLDTSRWTFIKKCTTYQVSSEFIVWNTAHPLFKSNKIRKALTMLVNRSEIGRILHQGLCREAESMVSPLEPGFDPSIKQPMYDPIAAKKLLADEGWTDSDGDGVLDKTVANNRVPFRFTMTAIDGEDLSVPLIMVESMRKVGIEVNIIKLNTTIVLKNLRHHLFDAIMLLDVGDPVEPDLYARFHSSFAHKPSENYSNYDNPQADITLDDIRSEPNQDKRIVLIHKLLRILADDQPLTFLPETPYKMAWIDRFDSVYVKGTQPLLDPRYLIVRGTDTKRITHLSRVDD